MAKLIDLTGQRFCRLTVVGRANDYRPPGDPFVRFTQWVCDCDCGETGIIVIGANLRKGHTRSCGCLRREMTADRMRKKEKLE